MWGEFDPNSQGWAPSHHAYCVSGVLGLGFISSLPLPLSVLCTCTFMHVMYMYNNHVLFTQVNVDNFFLNLHKKVLFLPVYKLWRFLYECQVVRIPGYRPPPLRAGADPTQNTAVERENYIFADKLTHARSLQRQNER